MKQCFACFSSFIISKALGWIFFFFLSWLLCLTGEHARHRLNECWAEAETQRGHHITTCKEMPKHPDASIMFPICSSCLSISHLELFGSWQFIRFSSPGPGMSHHQTTSGMERQSQPGLFLVMVCSPNDKPTGCVASGRVRLPFPSAAELLRGTQIETGGRAGGRRHTGASQTHIRLTRLWR